MEQTHNILGKWPTIDPSLSTATVYVSAVCLGSLLHKNTCIFSTTASNSSCTCATNHKYNKHALSTLHKQSMIS